MPPQGGLAEGAADGELHRTEGREPLRPGRIERDLTVARRDGRATQLVS